MLQPPPPSPKPNSLGSHYTGDQAMQMPAGLGVSLCLAAHERGVALLCVHMWYLNNFLFFVSRDRVTQNTKRFQ